MYEVKGLVCLQCGTRFPSKTLFEGCPVCRGRGKPSNVTVEYDTGRPMSPQEALASDERSIWRYRAFLGTKGGEVSLGEGLTPLTPCPTLGKDLGVPNLLIKNETMNPTGSYKDRLAAAMITRARAESAKGVAVSSTGNHGAATAGYAARAGLQCLVFTVARSPEAMKLQLQALGAMVIATVEYQDRVVLLRHCVEELGWYATGNISTPPIGSPAYGVDGYKTIAYEICESLGWKAPDTVVMPVAFGDGFWGTWKGFQDLVAQGWIKRAPRMIAAESGGSLTRAAKEQLDFPPTVSPGPSVAISIHTPVSTFQALKAMRDSRGTAVLVTDPEILAAQATLGGTEGIFVETASAAVVAGIRKLAGEGVIGREEVVVGVVTATGLKNPATIRQVLAEPPVVKPQVADLRRALKQAYGYQLDGA